MPSPLVQLELALHDADCPAETCEGNHGDKYRKLAVAANAVYPKEGTLPYWLHDLQQMIEFIGNQVVAIDKRVTWVDARLKNRGI